MNRSADDKKAFAQIMAEISDSDDDEEDYSPRGARNHSAAGNRKPTTMQPQQSKQSQQQQQQQMVSQSLQKSTNFDRDLDSMRSQPKSNPSTYRDGQSQSQSQSASYKSMSKDEKDIENFGVQQRTIQVQPVNPPTQPRLTIRGSIASLGAATSSAILASTIGTRDASGEIVNPDHYATAKRWLMRTCSRDDPPMLCYIERDRSGFGMVHQIYRCYMEPSEGQAPRFLMAAKKKSGSKTSYYLVSLDSDPDDRGSEAVLGKIRGNAVGSQYLITDSGLAPEKAVAPSMLRKARHFILLVLISCSLFFFLEN